MTIPPEVPSGSYVVFLVGSTVSGSVRSSFWGSAGRGGIEREQIGKQPLVPSIVTQLVDAAA